jgi:hypothetical protein
MPDRPATTSPVPIATLVLDPEALRQALIAALSDASVLEHLSGALRGASGLSTAALPTFMNTREYAAHARMSARSLSYATESMTESVHFSRNGRRLRYHVGPADDFLSKHRRDQTVAASNEADLKELARREAAKRQPKPRTGGAVDP